MKAPIHDSTSENILIESCTSDAIEADQPLTKPVTKTAIASKRHPLRTVGANIGLRHRHSKKIRAALMGRIRSTCVYSSSRSASAKVLTRGRHPPNKKTAHRRAKLRCVANLVTRSSYFNVRRIRLRRIGSSLQLDEYPSRGDGTLVHKEYHVIARRSQISVSRSLHGDPTGCLLKRQVDKSLVLIERVCCRPWSYERYGSDGGAVGRRDKEAAPVRRGTRS
jgi:hypothetical protein